MTWPREAADCANVVLEDGTKFGGPASQRNCFQLFLRLSQSIVNNVMALNPRLRWDGGLRVGLYAFWCADKQTTPMMEVFTPLTGSQATFAKAMALAMTRKPNGGTCPGKSLQYVSGQMEKTNPRPYPWSAVVLMTDGVFYDGDAAPRTFQSMRTNLCAFTYALAVAYTRSGTGDHPGSQGFTPAQLQTQRNQLNAAAGVDSKGKSRAYIITSTSPSENAYQQLYILAAQVSKSILDEINLGRGGPAKACTQRVGLCSYGDSALCTDPYHSRFCKWVVSSGASPQKSCQYASTCTTAYLGKNAAKECAKDKFCRVAGGMCNTNVAALPPPIVDSTAACATFKAQATCEGYKPASSKGFRSCFWGFKPNSMVPSCLSY